MKNWYQLAYQFAYSWKHKEWENYTNLHIHENREEWENYNFLIPYVFMNMQIVIQIGTNSLIPYVFMNMKIGIQIGTNSLIPYVFMNMQIGIQIGANSSHSV